MSDDMKLEDSGAIAIIGLACRYPGAPNLETFWENLRQGVESVTFFSDEELEEVAGETLKHPNYVKAQAVLENSDLFDAKLFGLTPREAGTMDPQQRLLLLCAWEALERAGYDPETDGAAMGVFAGSDPSSYLDGLRRNRELFQTIGKMPLGIGNDPDHLTTRLSYLLNLRGPSVPVQTACSTSLVAVHLACQSLLNFECDMALAGGVAVTCPSKSGYLYEEGGALSKDGRCRAFDASSSGTAIGSGVGLVVLKRLEEALEDRDHIHAVIRGSAINNDGAQKVGYTAPSVEGQRRVIKEAFAVAELEPETVSYVEAHGTGTTLGDPIEIEALRGAFGDWGDKKQTCAIGSLKTNIGHCNSAAGVGGLIKTVLCLENQTLVPSLNFEKPNPGLNLENSPFYVNCETKAWTAEPRLAGVSSFGIGGTNAHVIVQEAPAATEPGESRPDRLITLSAKTPAALTQKCRDLKAFLKNHPTVNIADAAFTLNLGRKALEYRTSMVCASGEEAQNLLASDDFDRLRANQQGRRSVVFLFPGQGSSYADMGRDLYQRGGVFRQEVDTCCDLLEPQLGIAFADTLFAPAGDAKFERLRRPDFWQPALFVVEYALARQWQAWGVRADAMMGHSIGEYVAATLAGVFTLADGLRLIAARGKATAALEAGAMLAVVASEETLLPLIREPLSLAAVNGPSLCVLSGPTAAVDRIETDLVDEGLQTIRLASERAFHSQMMEPVVQVIRDLLKSCRLQAPDIPFISNRTGTWITAEEATDPEYWARHTREAVRFSGGLETLFEGEGRVFLEVGPGQVLSNLTQRHPQLQAAVFPSLVESTKPGVKADENLSDATCLHAALGNLWCAGIRPDWDAYYQDEQRSRMILPTYPFEYHSFWLAGGATALTLPVEDAGGRIDEKNPVSDWFYLTSWKQARIAKPRRLEKIMAADDRWLVFTDELGYGERLVQRLKALNQKVIQVCCGETYAMDDDANFTINPSEPKGYQFMLEDLSGLEQLPHHVVHAWRIDETSTSADRMEASLSLGFDSVLHFAQATAVLEIREPMKLNLLTNHMQKVIGERVLCPEKAALLGAAWVLPKELPHLSCKSIDVDERENDPIAIDQMIAEMAVETDEIVAFRHHMRWVPIFDHLPLGEDAGDLPLRQNGCYCLVNALQEKGLHLAEHLAETHQADLLLVDRTFFPGADEWDSWIADQGEEDAISQKIVRVRRIMALGTKVRIATVNPTKAAAMKNLLEQVKDQLGQIHGLFHLDHPTESGLIQGKAPDSVSRILKGKIQEALVLDAVFDHLDFAVLFSENPAEGGIGKSEQGAAHCFLAHFSSYLRQRKSYTVITIDWGTTQWEETADDTSTMPPHIRKQLQEKRDLFGMGPAEYITALERALELATSHVIVSTRDFAAVMAQQSGFDTNFFSNQMEKSRGEGSAHPRPELSTAYVAPRSEIEAVIAEAWCTYFDLEQVGVEDNFFELGGHSLLAVQVLTKINETFAVKLTLKNLFDLPTIDQIGELIGGNQLEVEDADDVAALLAEIEGLSEHEINMALGSEDDK